MDERARDEIGETFLRILTEVRVPQRVQGCRIHLYPNLPADLLSHAKSSYADLGETEIPLMLVDFVPGSVWQRIIYSEGRFARAGAIGFLITDRAVYDGSNWALGACSDYFSLPEKRRIPLQGIASVSVSDGMFGPRRLHVNGMPLMGRYTPILDGLGTEEFRRWLLSVLEKLIDYIQNGQKPTIDEVIASYKAFFSYGEIFYAGDIADDYLQNVLAECRGFRRSREKKEDILLLLSEKDKARSGIILTRTSLYSYPANLDTWALASLNNVWIGKSTGWGESEMWVILNDRRLQPFRKRFQKTSSKGYATSYMATYTLASIVLEAARAAGAKPKVQLEPKDLLEAGVNFRLTEKQD